MSDETKAEMCNEVNAEAPDVDIDTEDEEEKPGKKRSTRTKRARKPKKPAVSARIKATRKPTKPRKTPAKVAPQEAEASSTETTSSRRTAGALDLLAFIAESTGRDQCVH